jgi:hypothetical protein
MLDTPSAIANADAIAAVPRVDVRSIGTTGLHCGNLSLWQQVGFGDS